MDLPRGTLTRFLQTYKTNAIHESVVLHRIIKTRTRCVGSAPVAQALGIAFQSHESQEGPECTPVGICFPFQPHCRGLCHRLTGDVNCLLISSVAALSGLGRQRAYTARAWLPCSQEASTVRCPSNCHHWPGR